MTSELVSVEQIDRDAAGDLAEQQQGWFIIGGNEITAIRHGFWDKCNDDLGVIVQAFARHRLAALEAQASRIAELEAGLRAIESAEATYRYAHDVLGGGDSKTGRAWDLMRRAGDRARTLLGDREG